MRGKRLGHPSLESPLALTAGRPMRGRPHPRGTALVIRRSFGHDPDRAAVALARLLSGTSTLDLRGVGGASE